MILARAPGAAQILWEIPRYSSNRDQETRRAAEDEKPPSVMMVTLARHVGRYEGLGLAGGMGHVQKDRDNNLGSGVSDAGYCLSARCADGSRNGSHDDSL
jgi:hypothetical protein